MGGLMKLNQHHHHNGVSSNGNSSNRGKQPYGLMIILAFGAAIIGVMVLHKVRERRVINLLVQEKDSQLSSLHLLLQKEREHAREAKWKLEEMKTKLHSLRAQKRGLDNRISEMQSTISSLREEQRTIEAALDERQNQIKLMRERYAEDSNENLEVKALSKMLRQKESEVEDLRSRLQTPVKVWSVSTDDPSTANVNLQTATSITEREDIRATKLPETNTGVQETANHEAERTTMELAESESKAAEFANEQSATQGKDTTKDGGETVKSGEKLTAETEKVYNSKEIISEHGNGNLEERNAGEEHFSDQLQAGNVSGNEEEKNSTKVHTVEDHDNEGTRSGDEIHKEYSTENKILQTTEEDLQGRILSFQGAENKDSELKLELSNQPLIGRNRQDGGRYLRKTKRKKLYKIYRSRKDIENSIKNSSAAIINATYTGAAAESKLDKDGYHGTLSGVGNHFKSLSVENDLGLENHERKTADELSKDGLRGQEIREQGVEHGEEQKLDMKELETSTEESKGISHGSELLRHDKDGQELSKEENATIALEVEKREAVNTTGISTSLDHISLKDTPTNTTPHLEDDMLLTEQQNNFDPKYEATRTEQPEERTETRFKAEVSEQTDPVDNDDEPENLQMEDATQTE
ncbi:OLC1v1024091C1 [Oldenlandia corymbosa var. corymbosa]|uniref:OLC1v1024091C1 n=1 Tax=Oldenlandia corymbosa var. corymbosa TaxID=529605 RepID=A0AAV1C1F1_OLDCO|nr:OLC1v1024091C1 [Oldenlandia corymbosa var. corymbosa]